MRFMMRLLLTASIWGGFILPMLFVAAMAGYASDPGIFVLFSLLVALIMTIFIWTEERIFASLGYYKQVDESKRKNTDQNADAALLLLELLSDDERQTIRQRLMRGNDGEIPQVFANMEEAEYRERYQVGASER